MSYSGQSNPPWQRNNLSASAGQGMQTNQIAAMASMHFPQNSTNQIFNQSYATGAAGNPANSVTGLTNLGQLSQTAPPIYNQTAAVSYPQSRGLNPLAFNQAMMNQQSLVSQHAQQQQQQQQQNQQSQQKQAMQHKIGYVTKLHNDCGFVDDEIFFHLKVCAGSSPKLGDRVLVEAAFNPNSPFKWTASRIQVIPLSGMTSGNSAQHKQQQQQQTKSNQHHQVQQSGRSSSQQLPSLMNLKSSGSGYNAVPPPNEYRGSMSQRGFSPNKRSPERRKDSKSRSDRDRNNDDDLDRKKRRDERERSRERRDRRDCSLEKRDRSPIRRLSPKRRRIRPAPRYMVEIPKISFNLSKADVFELRRRYKNLYLPSDFFYTQIKWSESFPPNSPFSIQRPCTFHVLHKSVQALKAHDADDDLMMEPTDLDYSFSSKVMLMGCPPIADLYQKSLAINISNQQQLLRPDDDREDERECIHPSRLINFLVGIRGKNETMAIGGPWSPSLDGVNPAKDPQVLIRTAIRNCKALTGIDLSQCTQWYRFVELYYHRSESIYKGKTIPPRVETVVIYLPDINSCMPTRTEWSTMQDSYKMKLDQILLSNQENCINQTTSSSANSSSSNHGGGSSSGGGGVGVCGPGAVTGDEKDSTTGDNGLVAADNGTKENAKLKPTHFSQLEVKQMKIQNLRDELSARNLSTKGVKTQLVARLTKALKTEREQEENDAENDEENKKDGNDDDEDIGVIGSAEEESKDAEKSESTTKETGEECIDDNDESVIEVDMTDIVVLDEYDSSKCQEDNVSQKEQIKIFDEKEIAQMERRYKFPEAPHILVHPSSSAKGGKFDCTVMSLSVLLDYRPEDTKERSFEVSLFAELFNEMLMRDFGLNIYKELMELPEKVREKDDEKKRNEENNGNNKTSEDDKNMKTEDDKKSSDKKSLSLKRPHEDESEDDSHSIRSDRKRKSKPTTVYVAKKELLLSFAYFDTTHCGFIYEKDLEELFYIIGLNLSRGQIRKLLAKAVTKDAVHYRKLTDKVKDDDNDSAPPGTTNYNILENNKCKLGNLEMLPVFDKPSNDQNAINDTVNGTINSAGMISHNGCLLDIEKLLEQMKRSEKARNEIEQILSDLKKQNSTLQISNTKSTSKIKDLQSEVKTLSKKLRETEDNLFSTNRKYNDYHSILQTIHDKISPIFVKPSRDRKDERSRDERSDRNRDKKDDRDKKDESNNDKKTDEKRNRSTGNNAGDEQKTKDVKLSKETKVESVKDEKTVTELLTVDAVETDGNDEIVGDETEEVTKDEQN